MKLRQLSYLVSIVDNGFNISRAATVVHTSQPGISTQIRALENELGVDILVRRRTRVAGITEAGKVVLTVARRMLRDAENLKQLRERPTGENVGHLVVATTHIYARYVLLDVVSRFRRKYPGVQLVLRQGTPHQIAELVNVGEADIGIGAEPPEVYPDLALLPGFTLERSIITNANHPVLKSKPLTLRVLVKYPIVTLDLHFTGGATVVRAFEAAGLKPNIVLRATDADVIKAYVARGLGIAVLPTIAYEPSRDRDIRAIAAGRLFPPTVARIEIRRDNHLRAYTCDFISMLSPKLSRATVERLVGVDS
jgi:LysR family cys regulon transcriptional activator